MRSTVKPPTCKRWRAPASFGSHHWKSVPIPRSWNSGRLRDSIVKLDDQLAVFERGGETLAGDERTRVGEELRGTRVTTAQRLATTVAALESIRLDLLRLQMGAAGIESVTASLDAARSIGDRIAESLEAQAAVEALLRNPSASPANEHGRSDTPIEGVAAAGG